MPPNRCFCSEHIVLAGRQHFITLWHYTHPNTFSNRYPLFWGGTTVLALFAIIIDVDFDVELENLRHRFCHHRLSLWMQLMKPQWNGPLLRSCIWSVLLWRCFFFTFWSGIALMSLLWRPGATKILPPIPAIEGSVKQDLSLFAQISFFVSQIHISILGHIGVKGFLFKTHHLIPLIYIFFYVVLDQCWDAMYFPLSRSLLVYLSRFLSEHLMKRSHLGQLWAGRQQGSWATCSNPPCLYLLELSFVFVWNRISICST